MRTAVNIQCLAKDQWGSFEYYAHEIVQGIVQTGSKNEWCFFSDRPVVNFHSHQEIILLKPVIKGTAGLTYWYDIKLTGAVKKFNADILINLGHISSLTSKVPQLMVVGGTANAHPLAGLSKSPLLLHRLFQKKAMAKAKQIVTASASVKQQLIDQQKITAGKITAIPPAAHDSLCPISFEQRESVKDGYADGREYFLFVNENSPHVNLMNILKAFSIFKKWQQSSMKLLVMGEVDKAFMDKLSTYKHRDDIVLLGYLPNDQLTKLMAAAYAFLHAPMADSIGLLLIEAMQMGIPVITSHELVSLEIGGDAAVYVNPNNVDEVAHQLKTLYRDESVRSQLIQKGIVQAKRFSWQQSIAQMMEIIETTAST